MKLLFLSVAFYLLAAMPASAQSAKTLIQCIEQALESNYSVKMTRNREQMADNDANYSPFLPTVDATAKQTQNINNTRIITNGEERETSGAVANGLSAGVALNWRLFDGMGMFMTYSKYQEMLSVGELNTRMAIESLIAEVSTAYYNVIVQHSRLEADRHSLDLSMERYNEACDKYELGSISGLEMQQAKLYVNADSSEYMKQQEYLKSAYISLNMIMNADLQQAMYVQDSIVLSRPLAMKELYDNMLDQNTMLQIARKDMRLSELDLKLARAALFPTLDLNSGYNLNRTKSPSSATTLNRSNGVYWGFTMNVNLFNRLENNRKIKNAKLDIENSEYSYKEAELQMQGDLAQLYNTYENNLRIVSFEVESTAVAYENLDAALDKYKLGALSGIEFREFQRSYIDAVDRKLSAIYQAKVSEISLLLISGEIGKAGR